MSIYIRGILAASVLIVLVNPASAQKRARVAVAKLSSPIKDADRLDATKALATCTSAFPMPRTCEGNWRGLKWLLATKTWVAQIDLPSGIRWFSSCRYDAIDREDRCVWSTGDEFSFVRGEGYSTLVNWGNRRFPGSNMEARFDDQPPFSTATETWSSMQSNNIYRKMLTAKLMRYRWFSWPEKSERGGRLDLANFSDAAALMEALRDEFTVKRILKQIPVDQ